VSVSGVLFSVGVCVCVCDLLIFYSVSLPLCDLFLFQKVRIDCSDSWDFAFAKYCHYQYYMVYSIQKEGQGRGVSCAVVAQHHCNSAGLTGGRGNSMMIASFTEVLK